MLQIDFDADLNWVDDEDRNIAKVPDAAKRYSVGDVAVAGRPGGWTWALIEKIDNPWVFFKPISSRTAASRANIVLAAN
jgi:hypothetical protein